MWDENCEQQKECESCYWFDECGCDEACSMYEPLDTEELYKLEYEKDLEERRKEYYKIIVEMGGAED